MKKQSVRAKFDGLASRYATRYDDPMPLWFEYVKRMELLIEFAQAVHAKSVLDAGCGPGVVLSALRQRLPASRFVGVDLSTPMLKEAAAVGFPATRLLQADVENLPFREASFDLVYALGVINFLDQPARFLASVCHVLKPGGYVVFTYPNKNSINRTLAGFLRTYLKDYIRPRSAVAAIPIKGSVLEAMVDGSGLDLLETRFITYGNGLVSLPWSAPFSRALEHLLGQNAVGGYLAWSGFCVARKPAAGRKADVVRKRGPLRSFFQADCHNTQTAARAIGRGAPNTTCDH